MVLYQTSLVSKHWRAQVLSYCESSHPLQSENIVNGLIRIRKNSVFASKKYPKQYKEFIDEFALRGILKNRQLRLSVPSDLSLPSDHWPTTFKWYPLIVFYSCTLPLNILDTLVSAIMVQREDSWIFDERVKIMLFVPIFIGSLTANFLTGLLHLRDVEERTAYEVLINEQLFPWIIRSIGLDQLTRAATTCALQGPDWQSTIRWTVMGLIGLSLSFCTVPTTRHQVLIMIVIYAIFRLLEVIAF